MASLPEALERTLALLEPRVEDAASRAASGYLDLLDGTPGPLARGAAPRLMRTRVVPAVYERWWRPAFGWAIKGPLGPSMADEHRLAGELLELGRGDGVLDVACGPGNFCRGFAPLVGLDGLVVGIDASTTMLARAVHDTNAPCVGYVRGDAVRLPFRAASFDAVCCFAALHMFDRPFLALERMARVLTPGGRIALFTSCRLRSAPLRVLDGLAGEASGQRMFEREEITGWLAGHGFTDVRQQVGGLTQIVAARRGGFG